MKTPETQKTEEIIDALHKLGYTVKKIYNGGTPARVFNNKIIYKKKPDEYKGIPDLIAINKKKKLFLFIEVKREKGRVKPEQAEFIEMFNNCSNFKALVLRDINELLLL
jgi:signal recognition particle subunit SEC65